MGLSVSGTTIGIIALGGIIFFFIFGLALLLYGGTQRFSSLVNEKQAPAQRLDYHFYKSMASWARNADERLDRIESKLEKMESKKE